MFGANFFVFAIFKQVFLKFLIRKRHQEVVFWFKLVMTGFSIVLHFAFLTSWAILTCLGGELDLSLGLLVFKIFPVATIISMSTYYLALRLL